VDTSYNFHEGIKANRFFTTQLQARGTCSAYFNLLLLLGLADGDMAVGGGLIKFAATFGALNP
jgi:hypothetical protein